MVVLGSYGARGLTKVILGEVIFYSRIMTNSPYVSVAPEIKSWCLITEDFLFLRVEVILFTNKFTKCSN